MIPTVTPYIAASKVLPENSRRGVITMKRFISTLAQTPNFIIPIRKNHNINQISCSFNEMFHSYCELIFLVYDVTCN